MNNTLKKARKYEMIKSFWGVPMLAICSYVFRPMFPLCRHGPGLGLFFSGTWKAWPAWAWPCRHGPFCFRLCWALTDLLMCMYVWMDGWMDGWIWIHIDIDRDFEASTLHMFN